jgi:hypothetical protein
MIYYYKLLSMNFVLNIKKNAQFSIKYDNSRYAIGRTHLFDLISFQYERETKKGETFLSVLFILLFLSSRIDQTYIQRNTQCIANNCNDPYSIHLKIHIMSRFKSYINPSLTNNTKNEQTKSTLLPSRRHITQVTKQTVKYV